MLDLPSSMPIELQMDADKGGLDVPLNTFTRCWCLLVKSVPTEQVGKAPRHSSNRLVPGKVEILISEESERRQGMLLPNGSSRSIALLISLYALSRTARNTAWTCRRSQRSQREKPEGKCKNEEAGGRARKHPLFDDNGGPEMLPSKYLIRSQRPPDLNRDWG
jgi:hypothetical protein